MSLELLLVIAVFAMLGRLGAGKLLGNRSLPPALKIITQTGTLFIAIGALAGPGGLGLVKANQLRDMHPVLVICTGWIGFLYGCHFEVRHLRLVPGGMLAASFAVSVLSGGIIATAAWFLLPMLLPSLDAQQTLAAAFALGICGAGTAPAGVFLLARNPHVSRHDIRALQVLTAFDEIPAVLGLAVLLSWLPHPSAVIPAWQLFLAQLALGAVIGVGTHLVFPAHDDQRDRSVILIAVAALSAGAADLLVVSPLMVSLVAGMVFMNLSPRGEAAFGLMAAPAHTLFATFLLLCGALLQFTLQGYLVAAAAVYVVVRTVAKITSARVSHKLFMPSTHLHPLLGSGMLFQGGVSLVIAIEVADHLPGGAGSPILTVVVAAVFLNEVLGNSLAGIALATRR